jgi:hypothetical protein
LRRLALYSSADRTFAGPPSLIIDPYTASGIVGAGCFIAAYIGTLQGWLDPASWSFPAINLAGALLVLVSLIHDWNLPSVVLECFWGTISVYGLVRITIKKR